MTQRHCYNCKERPAKVLKTKRRHYKFATQEKVFCSQACAADYALLMAGIGGEGVPYWCEETNQWTQLVEGDTCNLCSGRCMGSVTCDGCGAEGATHGSGFNVLCDECWGS